VLDYVLPEGLPDAEEQEALRLLAAQAGIALRNADLYQTSACRPTHPRAGQRQPAPVERAGLDELLRTISSPRRPSSACASSPSGWPTRRRAR